MTPQQIMVEHIDDNPSCLVDYADENEIGEVYAALYAMIRNPVQSDQFQNAQDFVERHITAAIERYKANQGNLECANEKVREYFDSLAEAA